MHAWNFYSLGSALLLFFLVAACFAAQLLQFPGSLQCWPRRLTCLLHWLWANPTGTAVCAEKYHSCKPVTGVWVWLCAHLWITFFSLGEGHAAQPLAWQHSLILLGSHERLQGISCCCLSAVWPSFVLLSYCWAVSPCVAQRGHCQKRGQTQALSWYPDEILNLNALWPLWGNTEPTE